MKLRARMSWFLVLCVLTACDTSSDEPDGGASRGPDASTVGGDDERDGGRLDAGDASLRDDDDADAAVLPGSRNDAGAQDDDAGMDASASDASDASDGGDAADDGGDNDGSQTGPGQSIAFPLEVILVATATPYGLSGDRPCALDRVSLRYENAYDGDELVSDDVFRFVARDWAAPGDSTDSNAISVWWSRFNSNTGLNTSFICATANDGNYALYSLPLYNGEIEPDNAWKTTCAWELVRYDTDAGFRYEIRHPYVGGNVAKTHSGATQGNRVRVGTQFDARFELVSPL